jgi:formylglycine-generating enzyme required for sulfatase activity
VIGSTSAAGAFPLGVSLVAAEELSGNVWEWTRSRYEPYPYEADEHGTGREDCRVTDDDAGPRVLRGGAFLSYPRDLRSACRYNSHPAYRFDYIGFRVVVSPFAFDPLISDSSAL